ncbi:MAG: hypothetical protein L0312_31135 [Acidobacteria bacterium]|nr:hypothetical protein [Acidobacteriota bacterium]
MLKNLTAISLSLLALCGCAIKGTIAIPRADGTGTNYYGYAGVGGVLRPGIMIVFAESGTNGPPVLASASGPPIAPSVTGAAGNVAAAATLSGLWPNRSDNNTTTVIANEPHAGPIIPPKIPKPPARPPKFPHDNRQPDHPKGHPRK